MKSAVFSTAREAFQVAHVSYAGPVREIPSESRKGDSSHSFKMITSLGMAWCYYRSEESARKARGALGAMLASVKSRLFSCQGESIDPHAVVSFTSVYELKEPHENKTHAFTVSLRIAEGKNPRLCLQFTSVEAARKARGALWAMIDAVNGIEGSEPCDARNNEPSGEPCATPEGDLPF